MRSLWKGSAALCVLLAILMAPGALAAERTGDHRWGDRFERAKRFIVTVLARVSWPPG